MGKKTFTELVEESENCKGCKARMKLLCEFDETIGELYDTIIDLKSGAQRSGVGEQCKHCGVIGTLSKPMIYINRQVTEFICGECVGIYMPFSTEN